MWNKWLLTRLILSSLKTWPCLHWKLNLHLSILLFFIPLPTLQLFTSLRPTGWHLKCKVAPKADVYTSCFLQGSYSEHHSCGKLRQYKVTSPLLPLECGLHEHLISSCSFALCFAWKWAIGMIQLTPIWCTIITLGRPFLWHYPSVILMQGN